MARLKVVLSVLIICFVVIAVGVIVQQNLSSQKEGDIKELPIIGIPVLDLDNIIGFGSCWGTLIDFGGEVGWQPHEGIDLNLNNNTYVIAGHNGTISGIWIGDYGNKYQIEIKINEIWKITHIFEPLGVMTIPEMNQCVFVELNEPVERGQIIGVLRGGGGHIHWDVLKKNESGASYQYYRTNPSFYLSQQDYIKLNNKFHEQIIGPDFQNRIYDLVMFNNAHDWGVPELLSPFKTFTAINSIRPYGVPNPANEPPPNETFHQDLDFNISDQTEILAPYAANCSQIYVNSSLHLLRVDLTLNPSFWLRFDLITNEFFTANQLLNFLNASVSIGTMVLQNQIIFTIPSTGAILHMGLARYNHTMNQSNLVDYNWDNPAWFFNQSTLLDFDTHYQTHDLENWHSQGFAHIY
ncbi:MAG: M23 family metallopeptidase [Candidatus Helarchaeota archaeon]